MPSRKLRRAEGFTLIELLVAFAIAALMLGALSRLFAGGLGTMSTAGRQSEAVLIAQSALDALGTVTVQPGTSETRIGAYRRVVSVRPRDDLAVPQLYLRPYEVAVQVSWREGRRERSLALSSLALAAPVAP